MLIYPEIMKKISLILLSTILVTSCVSKKEFTALQAEKTKTQAELVTLKTNLQKCLIKKEKEDGKIFFFL